MLIRNAIIHVAISFLVTLAIMSPSYAVTCPANAELWAGDTLCRCMTGYIENKGGCKALDIGTAKVRALELKSIENASDCRAMSRILNEFSRAVGFNSEQLASYAGKILSNGVRLSFKTLVSPVSEGYNYSVVFGDTGFRPQYQQDIQHPNKGNQVRHFVAYFTVGIKYANLPLEYASFLAELREKNEQSDIDLGIAAAALGRQAAGAPHMMENIGTSIRSQVCN